MDIQRLSSSLEDVNKVFIAFIFQSFYLIDQSIVEIADHIIHLHDGLVESEERKEKNNGSHLRDDDGDIHIAIEDTDPVK